MRPFRVACCSVALGAAVVLGVDLLHHRWTLAALELAIVVIAVQAMHIDTYRQFFRDLRHLKLPTSTAEAEAERLRKAADEARSIARLLHDHLAGQGEAQVPDGLPMWICQRPGYDDLDQAGGR